MDELHYIYLAVALLCDPKQIDQSHVFEKSDDEESMIIWLRWIIAKRLNSPSVEECFQDACNANIFVQKYIEKKVKPHPYPTHELCTKGEQTEAKFIYCILHPLL